MLFIVEIVKLIDVFFVFCISSATAATAAAAGFRRLPAVLSAGNTLDFSLSKVSTIIVF